MENQAKEKIKALVEKYELAEKAGKLKTYTEEETKKDFILPLFEALGWNVSNKEEVSAEETISASSRVDHGFYIDGRAKFYLEAKKLDADIHKTDYAKQAIRYSWNKGVTWAVLIDFKNILVFNTQDIESSLSEKLFFEISYDQYLERFDQLVLLSKSAFQQNLLDKEAEKYGKKLQRVSITALLSKDLQRCRDILTHELKIWNKDLDRDSLEEGVQKLLDRLVFLRVAEDRGIEPPILLPLIRSWQEGGQKTHLYQSMIKKFRELDNIYNSNLFSVHPFEQWQEYGGVTEKVFEILYGRKGYYEYDFKLMPADVLGSVYENYLSYKLSQSKQGLTLDKDARKRKEHGIYYTPGFVVDYIVKNALDPVLNKCKSVDDLRKIKVLDPACGSGSFLVKALEVISDKYKEFETDFSGLTKLQILTENIYGADLDEQAVEITRLNLLINALDERVRLPLLDKNIKHGNSLISGTDKELEKYFGKNFKDKKPFNWEEEFPEVFKQGGFNVVIGNPPYIFARGGSFNKEEKNYYYENFKLQQYQLNTYLLFIDLGIRLLKIGGYFGYIVPNNWLTINSFSKLREFLIKNVGELKIINAVEAIFAQVSVDTCVLLFCKTDPTKIFLGELTEGTPPTLREYKPEEFLKNDFVININKAGDKKTGSILEKLKDSIPLGELTDVKSGLVAYEVGKGKPKQTKEMKDSRIYHSKERESKDWCKYLDGVDVCRYSLGWSGEYIKWGENLAAPRTKKLFEGKRILVRQIPSRPPYCINAAYVNEDCINDRNSNNIFNPQKGYDLKYILGVINSRLISYWFINTFDKFQRKIFPQFKVNELAQFPIYPANKNQQQIIMELVSKLIKSKSDLQKMAEGSNKWIQLKDEADIFNKKIDQIVYKLYSLTPEEIDIVEGETLSRS
jgi:methylase of polypeptide subunit release factors